MSTVHFYSNRHIAKQISNVKQGDYIVLHNRLSQKRWSLLFRSANINEQELNITYITIEEFLNLKDVRFDAIVGNPPYSLAGNKKGKKGRAPNLYPDFYKKSVEMADYVSMIVPDTHRQATNTFNKFIRENTNKIIPIDDDAFDVNIATWCLIKDGSDTDVNDIEWADLIELPEQKVKWAKGKINVTTEADLLVDASGSYTVYHKINSTGLIQTTTDIEISELKLFPDSGYAVIMPQQIQNHGWTDTAIVECTGKQAATNGVNLAFVTTKQEAEYLVEYMKKEKFVKQALDNCGGMRNMTLGAMQRINMDDYAY
jgi:hypothetical protein